MARLRFADSGKETPLEIRDTQPEHTTPFSTLWRTHWAGTGEESPFLFKRMAIEDGDTIRQRHARFTEFQSFLDENPKLRTTLSGIPLATVYEENTGNFGLVMRRLYGEVYETIEESEAMLTLKQGLEAAIDLATEVAIINGHGIAHTDLSDTNLLLDIYTPDGPKISIIDFDLAAVRRGGRWRDGLEPSQAVGGIINLFWAPESIGPNAWSSGSIEADRWALAVNLHRLLFGMYFLSAFHDSIHIEEYAHRYDLKFPSPARDGEDALFPWHRRQMKAVGKPLAELFIGVFDRTGNAGQARPTATEWLRALTNARQHLHICMGQRCQAQDGYVVVLGNTCPVCGSREVGQA